MRERTRIGLRDVRALEPNSEIWDSAVPGFGARRQKGPAVAYVLLYRTKEGRSRRYTIGRHGSPWTPDMARDEARRMLGEVAAGADPAEAKIERRRADTVADLCDQYLAEAEAGTLLTRRGRPKKGSTISTDRSRIDSHIKPLIGNMKVATVTNADVEGLIRSISEGRTAARTKTAKKRGLSNIRGGQGAASRTVGLLGAIFTYAVRKKMRPDNPVHGVIRPADNERQRRLNDEEYAAFGEALRLAAAAGSWAPAVAAARFLAVTGWRRGEVLDLKWGDVDLGRRTAILPDSKTGRSLRPLPHAACEILTGQKVRSTASLVFPGARGDAAMGGFRKQWDRMLRRVVGVPPDITPHTLRHSFASLASDLGYSEPTIAALVGHKGHSVTARYVHAADTVLLAAADRVADRTSELMGDKRLADVAELQPTVHSMPAMCIGMVQINGSPEKVQIASLRLLSKGVLKPLQAAEPVITNFGYLQKVVEFDL